MQLTLALDDGLHNGRRGEEPNVDEETERADEAAPNAFRRLGRTHDAVSAPVHLPRSCHLAFAVDRNV